MKRYSKKRTNRRTKRPAKTNYLSKGVSLASKAYNMAKFVASLVNAEFKWQLYGASGAVGSTWNTYNIGLLAQGADYNQRTGNSVKCKAVQMKSLCRPNAAIPTSCLIRYVMLIDKGYDGVNPLPTEVFTANNYLAHYNANNCPSRFIIIYDHTYAINVNGEAWHSVNMFHDLEHHLKFTGTTANIADAGTGQILLFCCSSEPTDSPSIASSIRLSYLDN